MGFLGPIALIGIGCISIAYKLFKNFEFNNRDVVSVEATVLEASVKEDFNRSRARMMYKPTVKYRYEIKGNRYESTRLYFGYDWYSTSSKHAANEIIRRYQPLSNVTAYVDSKDLSRAYLVSKPRTEWVLYVVGVVFITVGLFFLNSKFR